MSGLSPIPWPGRGCERFCPFFSHRSIKINIDALEGTIMAHACYINQMHADSAEQWYISSGIWNFLFTPQQSLQDLQRRMAQSTEKRFQRFLLTNNTQEIFKDFYIRITTHIFFLQFYFYCPAYKSSLKIQRFSTKECIQNFCEAKMKRSVLLHLARKTFFVQFFLLS